MNKQTDVLLISVRQRRVVMPNSMYSTETWIMKINKKETKGYAAEWRSASHSSI